jgi:hypothetical protein
LQQFVDAWRARGLDLPPLVSTLGQSSIFPTVPGSTIRYDADVTRHNLAVYRPGANAVWHIIGSLSGGVFTWGTTNDKPAPADYDGDGFTDLAVWRPGYGNWFIKLSASGVDQVAQWGFIGDIPLPGDYDGDGEADLAVYRPSNGTVYIHGDECGGERTVMVGYGTPVVGDFDGDTVDEPGIYDGTLGVFWIRRANGTYIYYNLGATGGQPVIADYDGDFKSDAATYDSSTGNWRVRNSNSSGAITVTWWGAYGEIPVPGDYDGDNRADLVTWSTIDGWWWLLEADGDAWQFQWGMAGDIPVAAP